MERDKLLRSIEANLRKGGIQEYEIYLQPDPYNGWRLAVVSKEFERLRIKERKIVVLAGIEEHFEWLDLLSPEEKVWAGPLPGQEEISRLPLWPEALSRGNLEEELTPLFFSDLDEELDKPIVVTFYSLRGGVGRSTALAYTGRILSEMGHRVVCVDMDLEAPGLPNLLGIDDNMIGDRGVVSLLRALDQQEEVNFSEHLLPVPNSESLFLIPAGVPNAEYARRLRFIELEMWYREDRNPLRLFLDGLKNGLPFTPDIILLDSRTGISEMSGPLLFDLADMAIVAFFPHPQAKRGTELLTRGLLSAKVRRIVEKQSCAPSVRFLISPIPNIQIPEVVKRYRNRPLDWINGWMENVNAYREKESREPFYPEEISHFISYNEAIATSDIVNHDGGKPSSYSRIAEWIVQLLPEENSQKEQKALFTSKQEILAQLSFSTGIAEAQENLLEQFIQTDAVNRAMAPETALVLGRKGTGKTALFRKLSEGNANTIIVHAPQDLKAQRKWMLNYDGFFEVESLIEKLEGAQWRHFWCYYVLVAIGHHLKDTLPNKMGFLSEEQWTPTTISSFLDIFSSLVHTKRFGLMLTETLETVDQRLTTPYILVLDGLDTGFGSTDKERGRRKNAIEGLLSFWSEVAPGLKNCTFKIFLREDIWKEITLQNKSHLHGRSVHLKWKDQASYVKVAIRQIMDSRAFQSHLEANKNTKHLVGSDLNDWHERDLFVVWNLLVGERMKGGNTTFTRNWVWNRLSDANQDHSPRFLLQLLHHALDWERTENQRSPYARSIIRPRAMIACLEKVSNESLQSIVEEFKELQSLVDELRTIRRSPFQRTAVERSSGLLELAVEVGLLEIHEEDSDGATKYKVPDFYRLALGMARKGAL